MEITKVISGAYYFSNSPIFKSCVYKINKVYIEEKKLMVDYTVYNMKGFRIGSGKCNLEKLCVFLDRRVKPRFEK